MARPPIVTMMGHVDHGKTTLLDAIRKSSVAAHETGGITQHIGAYRVLRNNQSITFIDTPGHAAFQQMRSRGVSATDVVVLVVSAAEGVKPQTIESIQHIQNAGAQYLVALTKIDLPEANVEKVKAQLTEHGVYVEGYGGDIVAVPVSAKTGEGLEKLLEMILLIAELMELKADPEAELNAIVIESQKDARKGASGTVLVKNGTLRVRETVYAEGIECKVRVMYDENGQSVDVAGPSTPVEILGWKDVPRVGSLVTRTKAPASSPAEIVPLEQAPEAVLKVILKADAAGTLEAIESSLPEGVLVLSKGVGDISEADVLMADAVQAKILGFRVKLLPSAKEQAELSGVSVKIYQIIYELLEAVEKITTLMRHPDMAEEILGTAEVVATFDIKGERIAGCKVKTGELAKGSKLYLKRGEQRIAELSLKSMRHGKSEIDIAKAGTECGLVFRAFSDIQIGDVINAYRIKEV